MYLSNRVFQGENIERSRIWCSYFLFGNSLRLMFDSPLNFANFWREQEHKVGEIQTLVNILVEATFASAAFFWKFAQPSFTVRMGMHLLNCHVKTRLKGFCNFCAVSPNRSIWTAVCQPHWLGKTDVFLLACGITVETELASTCIGRGLGKTV